MDNLILDEMIHSFKRMLLWIIVTLVFTTRELKDEAARHFYSGVVRIPGVCYGFNWVKGYQAIGKLFPERCNIVRLDFVLGYVKVLLFIACIAGISVLLQRFR